MLNGPIKALLIGWLSFIVIVGCKVNQDTMNSDADQVKQSTQKAAKDIGAAADKAGKDLTKSTEQGLETGKIKAALMSSKDVDTSDINVDTIDKTVTIKGSVPTTAMKDKVDQIAKAIGDKDYTILDKLEIKPKPSS